MQRFEAAPAFFASVLGLAMFAVIFAEPVCFAQPPGAGGLPANAGAAGSLNGGNEIIEVEGTYQGAVRGMMKLKRDDETEVVVQLPSDPSKLSFRADADPEMIQPGLTIRFEAEFGPAGLPTAPVSKIEIIRPMNAPGMSRAAKESLTPGVYPLKQPRANRRQPVFVPGPYRVVGVLCGAAQGMMIVAAGNTPVRAQVADDVSFLIRFNTLELAQPGDHVKVTGFYQPPDETKVRADTVQLSTERVIGEAPAKPERRGRRGRRRGDDARPAAAEDDGDQAAADDPFAR